MACEGEALAEALAAGPRRLTWNVQRIKLAVRLLGFVIPGAIRIFLGQDAGEVRKWILEAR